MRKLLFAFCLLHGLFSYSQQLIRFDYDGAGNQIKREYCFGCTARMAQDIKNIKEVKEEDLQKFFPEDIISYYPNPVKEELYLKWDLVNENSVFSIEVVNINGQIIKKQNNLLNENTTTLAFSNLPSGIYFVHLNYTNGEKKTLKIVKN